MSLETRFVLETLGQIILGIAMLVGIFMFLKFLAKFTPPPPKPKDHFSRTLIHLGGHPYIPTNTSVDFDIIDNKIYLIQEQNNYKEEIPVEKIKRCEVKNEQEITYDVTIPRMLILGPLALADKKRNVKDNFYLFLSYTIKGVEVNCLFRGETNIYDIQSQVTRLKIESVEEEGKEK